MPRVILSQLGYHVITIYWPVRFKNLYVLNGWSALSADKKFLAFFFRRLRVNSTGHYEDDFPFVSPCGPETNYIRCDDLPLVFTHILDQHRKVIEDISSHALNLVPLGQTESETELLSYGGTGSLLTVPFQPQKLSMLPGSGRVYHIGPSPAGGVGLVKSSLALELSPFFEYRNKEDPENSSPVRFRWRGKAHDLDDSVLTYLLPRQPNDRHS